LIASHASHVGGGRPPLASCRFGGKLQYTCIRTGGSSPLPCRWTCALAEDWELKPCFVRRSIIPCFLHLRLSYLSRLLSHTLTPSCQSSSSTTTNSRQCQHCPPSSPTPTSARVLCSHPHPSAQLRRPKASSLMPDERRVPPWLVPHPRMMRQEIRQEIGDLIMASRIGVKTN
jgi:hypothetical protein